MQTMEQPAHRIEEATAPLWLGSGLAAWGDVVRAVDPAATQSAPAHRKRRLAAHQQGQAIIAMARVAPLVTPRLAASKPSRQQDGVHR